MLVEGLETTRAALEAGYESISQFTREYQRLFGEPPMRDVQSRLGCCLMPGNPCVNVQWSVSRWLSASVKSAAGAGGIWRSARAFVTVKRA